MVLLSLNLTWEQLNIIKPLLNSQTILSIIVRMYINKEFARMGSFFQSGVANSSNQAWTNINDSEIGTKGIFNLQMS